jgi:myo-inositol-1(or 4)-monophosphatase
VIRSSPADDLRTIAVDAARAAGDLLAGYADRLADGGDLGVDTKSSATDPVSEADRAAERLLTDHLTAARPDDGLLGEEGAVREGSTGLTWVVDPLDGTVNFLYGHPLWCVSVACVDDDGTVAGAIHHPASGETFHAARGAGARLDDTPLACTHVDDLSATLVATGFAYDPAVRADQGRDVADLLPIARDVRRGGSAALDLAWVAAGRVDAYAEAGLNLWDWAAGRLLVTEAGGIVTEHPRTLGGRELTAVVAGGRAAHDHLVDWLGGRP